IAAIAHPFDTFRNAFLDLDNAIKRVKVIETFNCRCLTNGPNKKAAAYAKKHGLSAIAGSDAHTPREIGNAFTECNAGSEEELRKAILLGKTKVQGKIALPLVHLFSPIAKLGLIKKL
ncbi:MAG: PHP-associated domain-containing protein, partial [Candidatus Diapherotrites archaeon]|nr:PHP-associated domain-containing protein [Candidatus Diapherotrites archaeon]